MDEPDGVASQRLTYIPSLRFPVDPAFGVPVPLPSSPVNERRIPAAHSLRSCINSLWSSHL